LKIIYKTVSCLDCHMCVPLDIPLCKQNVCALVDNYRGGAVMEIGEEVESGDQAFTARCHARRSQLNTSLPRMWE
jgi:hypothetical protein